MPKKNKKKNLLDKPTIEKKRLNTRKILDNNYNAVEQDYRQISFKISETEVNSSKNQDQLDHELEIEKKIRDCVLNSKYENFNRPKKEGSKKKKQRITKEVINELYGFLRKNVKGCSKTDLYGVASSYFGIDYVKFYNSLSNIYKDELHEEIRENTSAFEKRNIKKLF